MRIITKNELSEILKKHKLWRWNKAGGKRADLSEAILRGADLCDADLRGAELCGADLCDADLRGADLCDADLCGAILRGADLRGADLRGADLGGAILLGADLCDADLRGAELCGAILRGADLCGADLRGADLCGAILSGADLRGADLCGADLRGADLCGAKNIDDVIWSFYTAFYPLQCPESGAFVGFKKVRGYIVKLEICEDALRSSATSRKCRCSKAKVLEIQFMDGTHCALDKISSEYDENFVYTVGEIVEVKSFDTNRWNECAPGIHFFITREEAVKY